MQIAVHWSVVLLLIGQWYTSDAIPRTHNPLLPPSESDLFQHALHNYAGLLIGALVLLRIGLRMFPPQSLLPRLTNWRDRASQAVHWALYFSLLGRVAAGFVTSYLWAPAARFHVLFWNVTLILVGLHIAAAAYHALRGDGVVWRMIPSTLFKSDDEHGVCPADEVEDAEIVILFEYDPIPAATRSADMSSLNLLCTAIGTRSSPQ